MVDGTERELDVVVFGATGFTGRLVAEHLARHAPAGVRVGLAGRSAHRLSAVRGGLGEPARDWPLLVADAGEPSTLAALAARTRVVATTVGPYDRHGLPLVEACARAGTDYADLAGEVLFVRASIDACHDAAQASGARIVHACGFDSVPSDLAVLLLAERARADEAGELGETTLVLRSARGGLSGGTLESVRVVVDSARRDGRARRLLADPYALSPQRDAEPPDPCRTLPVRRDPGLGGWMAPFAMASFNTRVVRRSNALQGWAYGRGFRYDEVVGFGAGPMAPVLAAATTAGLAAGVAALGFPPTRALLDRVLPSGGEGPSERARREGHFRLTVHTRTSTGRGYVAEVTASGDPGYAATAVMLGESALCLALDRDRLPDRTGVLTPATAIGTPLADRLRAAGFRLAVAPVRPAAG